ncbi:type II toxin-antitoxin system HicA family toxin [Ancylothrix sp. C2]|uniref:type II toxin-antitoxin system HicA family toxin n=1 Tax=Ancylothrix sp. D3o TaxID=2953691 RepID=UPI0021BAFA39|nr:type II toxin-antitoxin system HicA family toxin [Ancylothrix sp. D3o]MCT7950986.1 type II toxin-antitoxin system HicA family toxin [Ancylothrix sp. D3o]
MPRLPRISGQEAVRTLERLGFIRVRQTGSHVVLRKAVEGGDFSCVVPLRKELKVGTLAGVLRQAQVSPDEFIDNL